MLIGSYTDYRLFLKDELGRRSRANARYSLRAFARDLEIAPQVLSLVLNGKKNISSSVGIQLAMKLRLTSQEVSYFNDLVEFSQAKDASLKAVIRVRLAQYEDNQSYRVIQEEVFRVVSDWHHYAILELTFSKGFKPQPRWIARRLGIDPVDAQEAIDRMLALGLLEEKRGTLVKKDVNLSSTHDVPSAALRKLATQLMEKATRALQSQSVEERDIGSMTMAIDPARLPQAKKMIRKFRHDLCEYLERGSRTEVYAFATELFRLTEKEP